MPRKEAAAAGHVCSRILIHAMDIVHPPDIGISAIANMDLDQTTVTVALAKKSNVDTPKKACWEARGGIMLRKTSRTLDHAIYNHNRSQCLSYSSWSRSQPIG